MPSWLAAVSPIRMNPAWAMLEYASIRLMSVWATAIRLPTITVTAATPHTSGVQSHVSGWNDVSNTRMNAANAATLVPADMYAVTGVGAPRATSGVHMGNGTAAPLKPNPTPRNATAARASPRLSVRPARPSAMADRRVDPVAPYAMATPYRKKAEENAPSRKYFIDPSTEARRAENPVRTYSDSDRISSARNTRMRSAAAAISVMPAVANSTSA